MSRDVPLDSKWMKMLLAITGEHGKVLDLHLLRLHVNHVADHGQCRSPLLKDSDILLEAG